MMVQECIFCLIADGRLPAQFVDKDEYTLAFMDINPLRRGHAVVIPRRHARDLIEIEPEEVARVFATAQRLAARMRERLGCERVTLWNACGTAAGQVVMHFHVHVVPGASDDPPVLPRPETPMAAEEIAAVATQLRPGA
jgi:histidine triad (HIT) family protein